jgi:hypothetical protein
MSKEELWDLAEWFLDAADNGFPVDHEVEKMARGIKLLLAEIDQLNAKLRAAGRVAMT